MAGSDSLNGKAISDTYKDLLQVPNANSGVDGTLRTVMDGEGTESTLQVSTAGVKSTGTLESTGNLTVGGTLTLDGTAISSLEDGATADQTGAEIKTAYEGEADTNAFTDADHSKLDGIEASANNYSHADHTGDVTSTGDGATVIANNAVTTDKINDSAVSTAKIADDAVTAAKLDAALNDLSNVNASPSDGQVLKWVNASSEWQAADDTDTDTTYSAFSGDDGTSSNSGAAGLVPAPADGDAADGKFLKSDGTWTTPPDTDTNTTYSDFTGATSEADGTAGLVPQPDSGDEGKFLKGDGTWDTVSGTGGGISNVNEDTTPQLGGNLDVNGNSIVSASDGDIAVTPNGTGKVILDGLNWPTADGSADQVLKTDGSGQLSFTDASSGGGISNVSEDTTPQLGGDLDVNGQAIVSTSNADIEIAPNGTGATVFKGNTNAGKITLKCENNSHGVSLSSPAHDDYTGNFTLTLPTSVGTSGQVLSTDGTSGTAALSWVDNPDTTYSNFVGDDGTTSNSGTAGLVPAPADGTAAAGKYLKADGTWATPPDTTYSDFGGADGSSAGSAGLVPQPGASDNVNYLKGDGTWAAAGTVTSIDATSSGGLKTDSGSAITASGTLGLDANSLTSDTYTSSSSTSDSSGWSAGDEIVVVDSGTTNDPTKKIKMPCEIGIACSDESTEMSTGDLTTIMIPRAMTITDIKASLTTAPTSGDVEVDILYKTSGSDTANSIFDSAQLSLSSTTPDYSASSVGQGITMLDDSDSPVDVRDLAEDSFITVNLYSSDSDARGLKVWLLGYWS